MLEHLAREDDLADVGHADAEHRGGRGADQRAHLGAPGEIADARARLGEQRRAALHLDLGGARGHADAGDQQPADTERDRVEREQPVGGEHEQQQRGERRAEREPEVVERAEQAHRGRPPVARGEPRQPGQRGRPEQRGADARQRGAADHQLEAPAEQQQQEGQAADRVAEDRARAPAPAVHQGADQRPEHDGGQQVRQQHGDDGPGGAEAVVGEQRQRHVGEAGAQAGLRVGREEAAAGCVGEGRAQTSR